MRCSSALWLLTAMAAAPVQAQPAPKPDPSPIEQPAPYEPHLLRLAEVLGAMHRLDEICLPAANGVLRTEMQALIDAEASSQNRRSRLADAFNRSYRSFADNYVHCTEAATLLSARYREEALKLIGELKSRFVN